MFTYTQFCHPFTALVAGPTGSGKTEFIIQLISNKNKCIKPTPNKVFYCYSLWQERFNDLKQMCDDIKFVNGLIDYQDIDESYKNLVIIDDLMKEASDDNNILDLFTKGSHHKNTSVILITQNIFNKGKHSRTISLNSHYLVIFKNPRDQTQINHLARQMFPGSPKFLDNAFKDATKGPHSYLFIDLKQATADELRIQSNIFSEKEHFFYLMKN